MLGDGIPVHIIEPPLTGQNSRLFTVSQQTRSIAIPLRLEASSIRTGCLRVISLPEFRSTPSTESESESVIKGLLVSPFPVLSVAWLVRFLVV